MTRLITFFILSFLATEGSLSASATSFDFPQIIYGNEIYQFWSSILYADKTDLNRTHLSSLAPPLHMAVTADRFEMALILFTHPFVDIDKPDAVGETIQQKIKNSPFLSDRMRRIFDWTLSDPQVALEAKTTAVLIIFRDYLIANPQTVETFLRLDDEAIRFLTEYLTSTSSLLPFRSGLEKLNLKNVKCTYEQIENEQGGAHACERSLIKLMERILELWKSTDVHQHSPLKRFFHGLRAIIMERLHTGEDTAKQFIVQMVFLRLINKIFLNKNSSTDLSHRSSITSCLQRSIAHANEKGGRLSNLTHFFENRTALGIEMNSLLNQFADALF